ncbi:hypothetical protein V6M85_07915 [Sulfolobus tengchongensis]|uniref:Uncharacterized protein n=1 Tax=Sulfolobus tengchongensis TaxID=207809 RepID=A0AAX4KYL7_9CREN
MILLYLTLAMIIIHLIGSIISFLKRTFPRSIGNFVAFYEMVFYIIVAVFYSHIILPLLVILYFYLVVHIAGGILYIIGYLGKLYSTERIKYYGIYEAFEMLYLLVLFVSMI